MLDLLWVTVVISLLAMLIAVPIAIGIALFITQYAPRRLARPVAYVVDLLAAIPSIIYGIWGITVLAPKLAPVQRALYHIPGPLFQDKNVEQGTIFNGGLVLAIMILPIITAISRDVFDRTPRQNVEAAWALGATRWEMIRLAVLPYGRPGRHRRLDARSRSGARRDDRDHPDPVQVGRRIAVHVLDLQRRRDVRLQDREQRGRVQQPHADRSLYRGRPGPVRSDVRGQRSRPRRRHPAQGVRMSVTSLAPGQNHRLRTGRRTTLPRSWSRCPSCLALIPLVWLLWTVLSKGVHAITRNGWFTQSQRGITYRDAGGGACHAILGTFVQVLLCSIISVPIALMVGIYLVEYGRGPLARATTFMVDILTGIPSIVAALFIYAVFVTTFHGQRAGWLVSLALVMLMIPVIVRTTEEMLKLVPNELREASYALGRAEVEDDRAHRGADSDDRDHHRHRARRSPGWPARPRRC